MLIPCIDLQNGKAVQLVQGRRRELSVDDVFGLLDRFSGYEWLHVIDLDAAMRRGQNNRLVSDLCKRASRDYKMKVRAGGGVRTTVRAAALVESGANQVIVGSSAFRNGVPNIKFLKAMATKIGRRRVVIALDTMRGQVVIQGWRKSLQSDPTEFMATLEPYCAAFLCTDVDREGTMGGANLTWFRQLRSSTKLPIIAAGGVSTQREIRSLEKMGMDAAVGMALYKNRLR